jgi:hypothetical protein
MGYNVVGSTDRRKTLCSMDGIVGYQVTRCCDIGSSGAPTIAKRVLAKFPSDACSCCSWPSDIVATGGRPTRCFRTETAAMDSIGILPKRTH